MSPKLKPCPKLKNSDTTASSVTHTPEMNAGLRALSLFIIVSCIPNRPIAANASAVTTRARRFPIKPIKMPLFISENIAKPINAPRPKRTLILRNH